MRVVRKCLVFAGLVSATGVIGFMARFLLTYFTFETWSYIWGAVFGLSVLNLLAHLAKHLTNDGKHWPWESNS